MESLTLAGSMSTAGAIAVCIPCSSYGGFHFFKHSGRNMIVEIHGGAFFIFYESWRAQRRQSIAVRTAIQSFIISLCPMRSALPRPQWDSWYFAR